MPTPDAHAVIDGKIIPIERIGVAAPAPPAKTGLRALAPAVLRRIEWRSFAAGAGIVFVGSVATWVSAWWLRSGRGRRRLTRRV